METPPSLAGGGNNLKFYNIDGALHEAINAADKPVKLRVQIDTNGQGRFENVFEQDIVEANFYCLKEAAGGISSRGEVTIRNEQLTMGKEKNFAGKEVRVSFSIGEGLPYFQRFVFYIDDKGIQDIKGPGRKKFVRIGLRDLSARLRKTDEARDWTSPAVFTYSVVCDKSQPEKSIVHGIARRAGLSAHDIDCSTIPVTLPFIRLRRNVWAELSSLATAYRCHLECAPEKPLVFAHSPYQEGNLRPAGSAAEQINEQGTENNEQFEDSIYTFTGEDIFYLRKIDRAELYRNTVRLKVNMPVVLEKQEIWRYDDPPVFYDELLQAYYPFKYPNTREIEAGNYEARYKVIDNCGRERNVVFADEIDTKEEAEKRLEYDGGGFSYSHFDVSTNFDKASLTLKKEADGDLYKAAIYGRPIVLDLNRSSFRRDPDEIARFGTVALNVTGSYFSEFEINGLPQYEDWVIRELAERIQNRREFTVKTHRGLFNARVGARVQIAMNREQRANKKEAMAGVITALSFRYRRDEAFVSTFKISEL